MYILHLCGRFLCTYAPDPNDKYHVVVFLKDKVVSADGGSHSSELCSHLPVCRTIWSRVPPLTHLVRASNRHLRKARVGLTEYAASGWFRLEKQKPEHSMGKTRNIYEHVSFPYTWLELYGLMYLPQWFSPKYSCLTKKPVRNCQLQFQLHPFMHWCLCLRQAIFPYRWIEQLRTKLKTLRKTRCTWT